jgi:hypothetical protein
MTQPNAVFIRFRHSAVFLLAFMAMALIVACSSSKPSAEGGSASSSAPPTPPPAPHYQVGPAQKILCSVDILSAAPASESEPAHVLAQGWAASAVAGAPIIVVALLIDGRAVAETKTFEPRSDVAAAYDRPDFEKSGWKIEAPIKKLGPGKHTVTVRAANAHGDKLILPGVTLALQ